SACASVARPAMAGSTATFLGPHAAARETARHTKSRRIATLRHRTCGLGSVRQSSDTAHGLGLDPPALIADHPTADGGVTFPVVDPKADVRHDVEDLRTWRWRWHLRNDDLGVRPESRDENGGEHERRGEVLAHASSLRYDCAIGDVERAIDCRESFAKLGFRDWERRIREEIVPSHDRIESLV